MQEAMVSTAMVLASIPKYSSLKPDGLTLWWQQQECLCINLFQGKIPQFLKYLFHPKVPSQPGINYYHLIIIYMPER